MILKLLSTMLLLASSAVGAGAGQNIENHSKNNETSFCAPASPKGAYYNPNGEYGTTASTLYNYTETALLGYVSHATWDQEGQVEKNSSCSVSIPSVGSPTITLVMPYNDSTIGVMVFTSEAEQLDIYVDGVFAYTYSPFVNSIPNANSYQLSKTELTTATPNSYIWVFEKYNEIPLSPQPILDVVGDATTASAGILGNGFTAMIALFYANDKLTGLGIICLILAGVSLVWFAWRLVSTLFRRRA